MNSLKKEKVLITGGAGLVGTYLSKELLKTNKYQITIVDINVPSIKGVVFVKSDFSDSRVMLPLLEKFDYLIHLAGMVGVDNCRLYPEEVYRVNYKATKELIDWCIKTKIKKIIFASSSEIYGNSKELPFRENSKLAPISVYAKCKLKIEQYLKKVQEKSSIKVGIVRLFNVYGPGQRDMVIPTFIEAAVSNGPLTVLGDGSQTRTFMYVEDAASGILKVLDNDSDFEIFNLGSDREIKIIDLAKIILKHFPNSKSRIVKVPYGGKHRGRELEVYRRAPSLEKAKRMLGFEPKYTIEQGLKWVIGDRLGIIPLEIGRGHN